MADDESILVALATYNEIDNLPTLVDAIHSELPQANLLVVDDDSPDGTGAWCDEFASSADWLICHHREAKLGLGSALRLAMQTALERGDNLLVTLDADWSHPPSVLQQMVEASEDADVVIGSRYCSGGGIKGWSWQRHVASRGVNWAARLLLGLPLSDCSGNYRVYRTDMLRQLDLQDLQCDGYAHLEEILWHLQLAGAQFAEVPIVFTDRRAGESKISMGEVLGAAGTLLRLGGERGKRVLGLPRRSAKPS